MNYFLLFLIVCALVFGAVRIKRSKNDKLGYSKRDYHRFSKMASNEVTRKIFKDLSK